MIFVAARNLVRALDLGASRVVDQGLRNTLLDVRNLLEHWDENMAIFNTTPQGSPTRQSERFAATHPDITPYSSFQWDSKVGPKLLPSVAASVVRRALDAVDAWVLGRQPSLEEYVPPSQASPWRGVGWGADQWWPKL
jgi:hypothetical protein